MKKALLFFIVCCFSLCLKAQPVSYYVTGDADDWQLFMASKVTADLNAGGKTVFVVLTAGDEGYGAAAFNGSAVSYYLARERGAVSSAKFASDIMQTAAITAVPAPQTTSVNGHSLVKYTYASTVSYFLRLPDGNINGNGFSATGFNSLKKLKDGVITTITSVDGANTYSGWTDITATIEAIINNEKGANSQVWVNAASTDAIINPNDYSDRVYSSIAVQDAVNNLSWVGINEFINTHSANLAANLPVASFQTAAAIFALSDLPLQENKYTSAFTLQNKALLPMDYYSVKRSPSSCTLPGNLNTTAITMTTATAAWSAGANATGYDIEYKLSTSSVWTTAATGITALSVNLSGLTAGSVYDWRVRANCTAGNGVYVSAQFTTAPPPVCNAPSGLSSSGIANTAATISWAAVPGAANYDVDYKPSTAASWINAATALTSTSIALNGLSIATQYDWRVRANCTTIGLSSSYSQNQFTTTASGSCAQPSGLSAAAITSNAATVNWAVVAGAASYDVDYKLSTSGTWLNAATATTSTSAAINSLSPASLYDWRVRANCTTLGISSSYNQAQFTTASVTSLPVTFYVGGDGDDWQLYMSSRVFADINNGAKTVLINLTAGDEGNGNSTFNGSALPFYLAKEKGAVYAAKFMNDVVAGANPAASPSVQAVLINGHTLSKYVYKNTVCYFLRLPDGGINGNGFAATGNVSLKKLKDATVAALTSVDGVNNYSSWQDLTATIEAIVNAEKGSNTNAWLNTSSLNTVENPNAYSDHTYSSTAAQEAFSNASWMGVIEFITDHSANLPANLSVSDFQTASALFSLNTLALVENKYMTKFNASNKALLPMDYYSVKRSPAACNTPTGLNAAQITQSGASLSWSAVAGAVNYDVDYKLSSATVWTNAGTAITQTSINVTGLTAGTQYDWRLRANCASGNGTYVSAQFTTATPPSCTAPSGLTVSGITASGAVLNWLASSGAANYDVEYKLNNSSTWITAATATTLTSVTVSGLSHTSTYDWRVKANCTGIGLSSIYSQAQFSTVAVCDAPVGLTTTAITLNSATLNWAAVSGAANYTVEYKLASATTWTVSINATTALTRNISGLANSSVYDWRVRANCTGIGLTSSYTQTQFSTVTPTCSAPTGLTTTAITLNSATLNWAAVSGAANYTVEYKLASATTWTVSINATTALTRNISGLANSSVYDWRVRANCTGVGLTSSYTQTQFSTVTPTCSAPTGLTTTAITLNSATLNWAAVSGAANYTVEYKLASATNWTVAVSSTTALTRNISGLAHTSVYNWRVRANCTAVGLTSSYTQAQFSTVTATCAAPTGLTVTNITSTSATLNWTAVSGAANYTVEYKLSSSGTWIVAASSTTSLTRNITGLVGGLNYDWRVRANCTAVGLASNYTQSLFSTSCVDILETNETFSAAKSISVNRLYTAQIATATDKDYYRFSNSLTAMYMRITVENLPADYDVKLYNSSGSLVGSSETRGTGSEVIIYNPFLSIGTFRMYIYGYNGAFSNSQCYSFRVDLSSSPFSSSALSSLVLQPAAKRGESISTITPDNGAGDAAVSSDMKVFPVPAASHLNVSFSATKEGKATLSILNQMGQEVLNKQIAVQKGNNLSTVNISNMTQGIYFVRVNDGELIHYRKFLISR